MSSERPRSISSPAPRSRRTIRRSSCRGDACFSENPAEKARRIQPNTPGRFGPESAAPITGRPTAPQGRTAGRTDRQADGSTPGGARRPLPRRHAVGRRCPRHARPEKAAPGHAAGCTPVAACPGAKPVAVRPAVGRPTGATAGVAFPVRHQAIHVGPRRHGPGRRAFGEAAKAYNGRNRPRRHPGRRPAEGDGRRCGGFPDRMERLRAECYISRQ
jgi:hypothetical protein